MSSRPSNSWWPIFESSAYKFDRHEFLESFEVNIGWGQSWMDVAVGHPRIRRPFQKLDGASCHSDGNEKPGRSPWCSPVPGIFSLFTDTTPHLTNFQASEANSMRILQPLYCSLHLSVPSSHIVENILILQWRILRNYWDFGGVFGAYRQESVGLYDQIVTTINLTNLFKGKLQFCPSKVSKLLKCPRQGWNFRGF